MLELVTDRLRIARLTAGDAGLIQAVYNDPDFLRFVGDRGIDGQDAAEDYIRTQNTRENIRQGLGMRGVFNRSSGQALGICGLLQRDTLDAPDLGFGLLPKARGQGLAAEAALAVTADGFGRLGLDQLLAITDPRNRASIRLLEGLGFTLEDHVCLVEDAALLNLYSLSADSRSTGSG